MKTVTFKKDWDFRKGEKIYAFKAGNSTATDEQIEAARAAGVLEESNEGAAKTGPARVAGKAEG